MRRHLLRAGLVAVAALTVVATVFLVGTFLERHGPGGLAAVGATLVGLVVAGGDAFGRGILGTDVLRFTFVWYSIATGILIGIAAPLVGTFVVHRQMALIGETLAHTAFAGVAVGLFFAATTGWSAPLLLAALVAGIIGAFLVQWLADRTDAYGDVPIAIMLTGSFAVGTIVISWGGGFAGLDIHSYLFGNVGFVTPDGAWLMAVLTAIVVAAIAARHKQLFFITFDEEAARVAQLDVGRTNTLLVVLTAMVVVGAMQVLGIILVAALLVVPVAAASQVAHSFQESLTLAVLIGELSVLTGLAAAFALDSPPGGTIVMVAIALYIAAIAASDRGVQSLSTH